MQKGVPQIMDITSIRSVLHYLTKNILPTKFETAQQPEPNTIQLCFRGVDSQTWLEVSWNGDSPRILKINKPEKIGRESTLSKQIRYGLKYMALISIDQDDFERVIKFSFAKKPGHEIKKQDIVKGQKLYKKSKKLKRSRELIKERLSIYKTNIERLDEFTTLLENLNSLNHEKLFMRIKLLEEIMEEICKEFNINIKKQKEDQKSTYEIESSPIQVDTPTGLKLQVGRNMRQNDLISFKLSKKGDLWFHAQESPGSHVVLKSSSKVASEQDLQIAADLAALFSKAKRNIKVPINLVKIKDLQKIKNGGPGCVSFKNGEIIWGNPTRGEDYIKKNLKTVI